MRDFATVLAVPSEGALEVSFPYDPDVVGILKGMRARWNPRRKCWSLQAQDHVDAARQADVLAEKLLENAPDAWRKRLGIIRELRCVTRGYEIFVGEGGMRLAVPSGHACEYLLKEKEDIARFHRGKFYLKPEASMHPEIVAIIKRMMTEDLERYKTTMGESSGSAVAGTLKNTSSVDLSPGKFIYGNRTFVEQVDPYFAKGPLPMTTFPFKVVACDRKDEERAELEIQYPPIDEGYKALQNLSRASGMRVFTDEDVDGKWVLKSRMW